jgi:C4-dicarboxylate transporter DctQ subunit
MNKAERILQLLGSWLDRVTNLLLMVSGSLLILMALAVGYGVVTRYIFRNADPFAYEAVLILMLTCVVFSLAHTQRLGQHLRVDIMDRFLPESVRALVLNLVSPLFGLVFLIPLIWKAWDKAWFALQSGQCTNTTSIPTFPMMILIPFGVGLLCLVLIAQILRYLVSLKNKGKTVVE